MYEAVTTEPASVEADLARAERDGLMLTLRWRRYTLLVILPVLIHGTWLSGNPTGLVILLVALAVGYAHERLIGAARDGQWQRYLFATVDVAIIASILAFVPVTARGDVPQILAFRDPGPIIFLPLILSALSLSPKLVIWTGMVSVAGLWAAFGYVVSSMERTLSWDDLPRDPTADAYLAIVLDPDFIGVGNRTGETLAIVIMTAVVALATHRARRLVRARSEAEAQRGRITRLFGRYVPAEVAERVLADETALEPRNRFGTAMFIDVEGFTRLSETRDPREVIDVLNALFDRIGQIVAARDGVVISYAGDAVLAAFNAPLPNPVHARSAVAAGLDIVAACSVETFAGTRLAVRVGIATGSLSAGSIGSRDRQAYTVYGDTVNCAQRLEAANKAQASRLMIDRATWETLAERDRFRDVGEIAVKGRAGRLHAFVAVN